MSKQLGEWHQTEREAFWSFVRGRMAERRLRQADVADRLYMDRSVLGRRLSGVIKERPSLALVTQLSDTLMFSDDDRRRLVQLAGYGELGEDPTVQDPVDAEAKVRSETSRLNRRPPWWIPGLGIAMICGVLVGWLVMSRVAGISRASKTIPGGLWLEPAQGHAVSGRIHLVARAYPTLATDPAIAFVNFTVSWEGRPGPWLIACRVTKPVREDVYECDWDPLTAKVPAGPLHVSFDVQDRANPSHVNYAPNGVRTITYVPAKGP